jgi:hypothetical protein
MGSAVRALVVSLLFFPLASCNQMAMKQRQEKLAAMKSYCESLYADSRIDPIRKKVVIATSMDRPVSRRLMANDSLPTEEEKVAIEVWVQQRELCQQSHTQIVGAPPAHLSAVRAANSQGLADLHAGLITYGEFAKRYERNRNTYLEQEAALRVQAQHEAMQQQLASQPDDPSIPQKLFESLRMPQSGPSTNCTSQYPGLQAFSKCG